MNVVVIIARVVSGVVLVIAGAGKCRTRTWQVMATEMGTPRLVVLTLPPFEVLLGLAMVLHVGGSSVVWVAVALFVTFTVVIAARLIAGSRLPCACFGGSSDEPVSYKTVARNLALVAFAIVGSGVFGG